MDATLLTDRRFWSDATPIATSGFPGLIPEIAELKSHVLFETSGSTGTPKWIALSKAALLASAAAVNAHLGINASSCWGLALPLHHVGGFGVGARAFVAGCRMVVLAGRWDAAAFTAWIGKHGITHTSLVPAQVHDLVSAGLRAPETLRAIVVGGGRLDAETGRAARALGWPVLASYGMTEAASQIATQQPSALHTLYQPAPIPLLPLWHAKTDDFGILRIAGPALFSGTLLMEDETWIFKPRVGDWHQTQDRVELAEHHLTPLGRADTQIKVLGELVDLEMIEQELSALSGGTLVPGSFVIIAVPDARAEHGLVPVFDETTDHAIIETVLTAYAENAAGFRRLREAVLLTDFPRSPLGKPRRSEITEKIG
jgi:O-succinylbenzoic acid--CoA ligase